MIETEKSTQAETVPAETERLEATTDRVLQSALERVARSSLSEISKGLLQVRVEGGGE